MDGYRKDHALLDGRFVYFLTDEPEAVAIFTQDDVQIGSIDFSEIEGRYVLTHASVSGLYQRQGVGMAALRWLVEVFNEEYFAWPHDGHRYDDARHLSIEGAAFVSAAIREGLIRMVNTESNSDDEL